jgi:hypothetical protein
MLSLFLLKMPFRFIHVRARHIKYKESDDLPKASEIFIFIIESIPG